MNRDDIREREYCDLVRDLNRAGPPDDEYARIAAQDALTAAYGLDRYLTPPERKRRTNAATAAQTGGVFIEGSRAAERLHGKRRSSGGSELSPQAEASGTQLAPTSGGDSPCRG